jgi:hypothetical protein
MRRVRYSLGARVIMRDTGTGNGTGDRLNGKPTKQGASFPSFPCALQITVVPVCLSRLLTTTPALPQRHHHCRHRRCYTCHTLSGKSEQRCTPYCPRTHPPSHARSLTMIERSTGEAQFYFILAAIFSLATNSLRVFLLSQKPNSC